jgi:hypothetical protein
LYCTSEDCEGWTERAERQLSYLRKRGVADAAAPHRLFVANGVPPLSLPSAAITCIRDTILDMRGQGESAPVLIIIDVLRAAAAGDENASEAMGLAMATAHAIANMTGAFVMVVHHSAVSDPARARGSGAIEGALDFEATFAKQGENTFKMTVKKNKGGPTGDTFEWHIPAKDAPLHEGPGAPASPSPASIEAKAIVAAHTIRDITDAGRSVTKTELNGALFADRPDLFSKADGKKDQNALHRARERAIRSGWIVTGRGNALLVGPTQPPPIEAPDLRVGERLEDLIG